VIFNQVCRAVCVSGQDDAKTEEQLMAEIAAGREVALAALMARHGRAITLFAGRSLGSLTEAEDVAQEVFLRVWRNAKSYDPARAKAMTWVYRITVNLCIDRQRRARFWRLFGRVGADELADTLADPAPDAATTLAGRQTLALTRAAIATLPDRQRMAIMLAAISGLETAEIATAMGTSTRAVEQLLVRARRALREELGEDANV
jgi:RNA polymerase sigma-70 factor, ECF subfamily